MARKKATPRIHELANKIQADTAPHQIDEAAVTKATEAGSIDDGDSKEFMQFLKEIGEDGNVDGDDVDDFGNDDDGVKAQSLDEIED
jgi:hypothetical protein